jgi:hypothetical protein
MPYLVSPFVVFKDVPLHLGAFVQIVISHGSIAITNVFKLVMKVTTTSAFCLHMLR